MSMTLTGREILELAQMAGLPVAEEVDPDLLETEYTVIPCPVEGVLDEDSGQRIHTRLAAYASEYPEEGVQPLGEALPAPAIKAAP